MLVDDLGPSAPHKLDGEVVEAFDPAHQLDPVHEKHRHLNVAIAEVLEERVLKG